MYQSQTQETRIQASAHLAQTMTMLGMSSEEIREKIEGELAKNPFLELVEDRVCPTCKRKLPENGKCPICSNPQLDHEAENIIFVTLRDEYNCGGASAVEPYRDEPDYDSAQSEDLATYVLKQVGPDLDEQQKLIAAYLLNSLDSDGFITADVLETAQYYHVMPSDVEEVIEIIQHADPLGVGSRDLKEALLVQLNRLSDYVNVPPHTQELIETCFEDLTHSRNREIAKLLGITVRQVNIIEKFIGDNLNPYPARAHWGGTVAGKSPRDFSPVIYHEPDIIIYYMNERPENPLVVEIVMPISGYLRVNNYFKKELKNAPDDRVEEWRNDLDKANLLVKSLYQRNNTMSDLMTILVNRQEEYIRKGEEHLLPLTRAQIAVEMGVHESTISRAVSNKTVQLPNRKVVALSSFFDRSLNVRTVLKELIQNETKPLSDAKLVTLLNARGFNVARRTVAKYRLMEGIGSAHQRSAMQQ